MTHVLVTNDFPPKVGGIQSYLWELWSRLPADRFAVLTIDHQGSKAFDDQQPFQVERLGDRMLLPTRSVHHAIDRLVSETGASAVVLDPALPIGWLGPRLDLPYAVVLHGAEVTVPARLPGTRQLLQRVLSRASLLIAAGSYPLREAHRCAGELLPPAVVITPGVDSRRFAPLDPGSRRSARAEFGLPEDGLVIVAMSRLVPRKGFDVLIEAAADLAREGRHFSVAIAGEGRDRARLEKLAAGNRAPVTFLGRVPDDALPKLLGTADIYSMLCRTRWLGLEQEGFGIVFLEAAAAGVPQLAGLSGGVTDAVVDEVTGLVVDRPADLVPVTDALRRLLDSADERAVMGGAARDRVVAEFGYDDLAAKLDDALVALEGAPAPT